MTLNNILMDNFKGGMTRRPNRLNFDPNSVYDGLNVELAQGGVFCRPGSSISSTGSLPAGEVMALENVRFPTNEVSYLVAEVKSIIGFEVGATPGGAVATSIVVWDTGNGVALCIGDTDMANVWQYDPALDSWTDLAAPTGGTPHDRFPNFAVYVPSMESVIMFGGWYFDGIDNYLNDTWLYSCTANTWAEQTPTGDVPAVGIYAGALRTSNNTIILFNGASAYYELNLNTWVFTEVATTVDDAGFHFPDGYEAIVYDSVNDTLLTAGGTRGVGLYTNATWQLDFITAHWTRMTDVPSGFDGIVDFRGFYCSGLFHILGLPGAVPPLGGFSYTIATDTWTTLPLEGTPPTSAAAACLSDSGTILLWDGTQFCQSGAICGSTAPTICTLYASPTHLPTSSGVFTAIYELGRDAGVVTFGTLNDRVVITEGKADVPLVWAGAMDATGLDWPHPKHVLVTQDGNTYYDISAEVCDKDSDTVATVENIRMGGHIDICLDVPLVEALHIEMETPNTGLPVESQVFAQTTTFDTASEVSRQDLKATIVQWYKDGAGVGHFEGEEIDIDAAAAVNKGGGLVGIPATGHGITSPTGKRVRIEGTTNYNGIEVLDATTSANELVITAPYVAETFNVGTEKARPCRTLGAGKDCVDVVPGCSVDFAGTEIAIVSQTGDGDAGSGVTLESDHATALVTAIYGLVIDNSTLTVESVASGSMADSFTKTLDQNPFIAALGVSVRQVIKAADITTSGDYVEVTIDLSNAASTLTQANQRVFFMGASIVERSGSTGDGTTTPTVLNFTDAPGPGSGQTTCKLTKFTIDETKDYLVIMDFMAYYTYIYGLTTIPATWNVGTDAGKAPSVFLSHRGEGGGFYWKTGGGKRGYGFPSSYLLATMPTGFTDLTGYTATVGVSNIRVHTTRSSSTALHVATTTDTNQISLYFADSFVGITAVATIPGTSKAYVAVSLDDRLTFQIWSSTAWRSIVRENAGLWQYKDGAGAWQNASIDTQLQALRQAFAITENQMTPTQLGAITQAQWIEAGGFVAKITQYVDLAVGLQLDGSGNIPSISSFTVTFNDSGSVVIEGYSGGVWTEGDGWTDGTLLSSVPLGQSGIIEYDGASPMVLDYTNVSGVPGYWLRIRTNGTAPGTAITRIKYKAPCQPLANIGNGVPNISTGVVFVNGSTGAELDLSVNMSEGNASVVGSVALPMTTADHLYFGFGTRFRQVQIAPYADPSDTTYTNNQAASTAVWEYWNGEDWATLTVVDGTFFETNSATLGTKGLVSFEAPSDWKTNVPFNSFYSRGYWVRMSVSANLTTTFALSEVRIYGIPDPIKKHRIVTAFKDRIVLLDRPDAPSQADISREMAEYGFCDEGYAWVMVGSTDAITSAVSAWDGVIIGKGDTLHHLTSSDDGTISLNTVEAARHVPINSQVVVKAPVSGLDYGDRYGLYFINRYGAFVMTGLHTDTLRDTSRGKTLSDSFWDEKAYPHLELDYLNLSQGVYFAPKNQCIFAVPMRFASTDPVQTTNNALIVYDLTMQAWLPPFTFPFGIASLCVAFHYNAYSRGHMGDVGLYAGDYEGRVIRLFDPAETDDLGTDIAGFIKQGYLNYGQPETEKHVRQARLYGYTIGTEVRLTTSGLVLRQGDTTSVSQVSTFTNIAGATESGIDFAQPNVSAHFLEYELDFDAYTEIEGIELGIAGLRNWPPTG